MVKIIDTTKEEKSELYVKGETREIMMELPYAVYLILKQLNYEETNIRERCDLFHGGLLFQIVVDEGVDAFKK